MQYLVLCFKSLCLVSEHCVLVLARNCIFRGGGKDGGVLFMIVYSEVTIYNAVELEDKKLSVSNLQ